MVIMIHSRGRGNLKDIRVKLYNPQLPNRGFLSFHVAPLVTSHYELSEVCHVSPLNIKVHSTIIIKLENYYSNNYQLSNSLIIRTLVTIWDRTTCNNTFLLLCIEGERFGNRLLKDGFAKNE
jgi:hypothetical protein